MNDKTAINADLARASGVCASTGDPFAAMYEARTGDMRPFGVNWCGPDEFEHGKPTLIARYKHDGDGQDTEVYCIAMPSRFYHIKALPGPNSVGEQQAGYELRTGSDGSALAATIAEKIASGMLGLEGRHLTGVRA